MDCLFQSLFDIRNNIACIFDADRQADQVGGYSGFDQLFVRQLAVRMAGRVEHTSAGICYVSDDADHLQVIHKADRIFTGTFQTEGDYAASPVRMYFCASS